MNSLPYTLFLGGAQTETNSFFIIKRKIEHILVLEYMRKKHYHDR
jgi:hypothetical protein